MNQIIRATYGTSDNWIDVQIPPKPQLNSFLVTNELFTDPAPGCNKELIIYYQDPSQPPRIYQEYSLVNLNELDQFYQSLPKIPDQEIDFNPEKFITLFIKSSQKDPMDSGINFLPNVIVLDQNPSVSSFETISSYLKDNIIKADYLILANDNVTYTADLTDFLKACLEANKDLFAFGLSSFVHDHYDLSLFIIKNTLDSIRTFNEFVDSREPAINLETYFSSKSYFRSFNSVTTKSEIIDDPDLYDHLQSNGFYPFLFSK